MVDKIFLVLKNSVVIGVIAVIIIFLVISSVWIALYLGITFSKNPAKPEIKYGEFPYKLVYELDGQKCIKEGKFICKYKGISMDEGRGKYRNWIGFIDGTDKPSVLLFEDEMYEIYCYIGDAEYYMGDYENSEYNSDFIPKPYITGLPKEGNDMKILLEDKVNSVYKIKIIDWEFSEPIDNVFS